MKFLIIGLIITFTSFTSKKENFNLKKNIILNGYDVVSYFDLNPIKGINLFTDTLDGIVYKFSSKENLNKFISNPKKYQPQYGGWCAYAMALNGNKVSVNPKAFEIRDGKLYLFYRTVFNNTLKKWQKENKEELIKKADYNWKSY